MEVTTTPAAEKIERCSAIMLLSYPWWASLYLHLVRIETSSVETMAVDGTHLFYNPAFTLSLSDKECTGVLMHETAHCAFLHCSRQMARENLRWNIACDKAVNAILKAANIALPVDCVPPGPLELGAEELYELVTAEEMKKYAPNDVRRAGSYEKCDKPMSAKDWKDAIAAAHGLAPDYVKRTVEKAVEEKKDWREELARFVHSMRKSDTHTWTRMSRRVAGLPGWSREIETKIALCIDTSGSIWPNILAAFAAEARSILDLVGVTAIVITSDCKVSQVLEPGDPFPTYFKGGGGTSFEPALVEAAKYEPNGIVYFTDGCGAYPKSCSHPVLWVLTKLLPVMNNPVPFGEKVFLDGEFYDYTKPGVPEL